MLNLKRGVHLMLGFIFTSLASPSLVAANDLNLPDLGGAGGGLVSAAQEYELGQQWQRRFRAQVATSSDPFLQAYTESLIQRVARYSDLKDKRLDVLVVENPSLNAFAVPGGVIGIHTGLFLYAQSEQQFASVVAHELAHLSQRHFARNLDEQKNNAVANVASLLASILVLATAGGEAGVAAISVSQASNIDNRLRFSRQLEQEADRIGMASMVRAGMNPYAMPAMFEEMLHASRFRRRPPEFLITHPLTESRISDAKLRAQKYTRKEEPVSLSYHLVRVRAALAHEKNPSLAVKSFQSELDSHLVDNDVARYGLALAQIRARKLDEAGKNIETLLKAAPENHFYLIAKAELLAERKQFDTAIKQLKTLKRNFPSNHPINIKLAETLMAAGEYKACQDVLIQHSERRPNDDYVWYLLAEAHGLAGDILSVHTARAEYFLLKGIYSKAENHIRNALNMINRTDRNYLILEQKLKDIQKMKRDSLI